MSAAEQNRSRSLRRWGGLALVTATAAFGLIVLGGVVRITGSGMGCGPDWPLCNGHLVPPMDFETLVEWGHRMVAATVSLLVGAVLVVAWWPGRDEAWRPYRKLSAAAAALLVVQVLLGAVTVWLELPPASVILHLGTAMGLLAVLTVGAVRALSGPRSRIPDVASRVGWMAAGYGLLVVLAGALVANLDAAPACQGFPLCNGRLLPEGGWRIHLHWGHRLVAYGLVGWSLFLPGWVRRRRPGDPAARRSAVAATALVLTQLGVAVALVLSGIPIWLQALHLAVGTAVFVALVVMALLVSRPPAGHEAVGRSGLEPDGAAEAGAEGSGAEAAAPEGGAGEGVAARLADYVTLTKPRIISLLLLTTVVPMYVAGAPGPWLVLWTVVGGYLMAGGANAINMYLDRDIDRSMARTCTRPIPAGRMGPLHVLAFGIGLGAAAFVILAWAANPVAASLAAAGLLFYVFVYTRWLKRSTPLNIVIGGAAGAFPPLVGWAAVTGEVSLTALFLFLIVFYWTPPHFWALALVKKEDYAEAGVPMAPVVWGDRKTIRQMVGYTLVLLPLTLVPVLTGSFGVLYGLAALALGGRLLWMILSLLRRRREAEPTGTDASAPGAMKVFRYSLLYLALLFGAMLMDQAVHLPLAEPPPPTVAERTTPIPAGQPVPVPAAPVTPDGADGAFTGG